MVRIIVVVTALLVAAGTVMAKPPDPRAEAAKLLGLGIELQKNGRHLEAIKIFDDAHSKVPHVKIRYYKMKSYQALGRLEDARAILNKIFDDPALAAKKNEMLELRKTFDQALKAVDIRIVATGLEGADVYVDGNSVGKTPFAGQLTPGTHVIRVAMKGYKDETRTVRLLPGADVTAVTVDLKKAAPTIKIDKPVKPPPPPKKSKWLQWSLIGGGAALALGSVGFFAKHSSDGSELEDLRANAQPGQIYDDQTSGNLIMGGVFAALGVGLVTTGLVLWPWNEGGDKSSKSVNIEALGVGADGDGSYIFATGRF